MSFFLFFLVLRVPLIDVFVHFRDSYEALFPFPLADGIGSASQAASLAQMLLTKGADVRTRCRWTDMNALHYAAFFNVGPVIETLLEAASGEVWVHQCPIGRTEAFSVSILHSSNTPNLHRMNFGRLLKASTFIRTFLHIIDKL